MNIPYTDIKYIKNGENAMNIFLYCQEKTKSK